MKPIFSAFTAAALLGTLAACTTGADVIAPVNHDADLRAEVRLVRTPHSVDVSSAEGLALSEKAEASLAAFLDEMEADYADTFFIDVSPGTTPEQVAAVEEVLLIRALSVGGLAAMGAEPRSGTVTLYLERHVVDVPGCGEWPDETNSARNNTSQFFGCTHAQALSLMAANPRDLVAGSRGLGNSEYAIRSILNARARARQAGEMPSSTGILLPRNAASNTRGAGN